MLLLKQDIIRKGQVNENIIKLNTGKDIGKYKIEAIYNSAVYTRETKLSHLPKLYYLVF